MRAIDELRNRRLIGPGDHQAGLILAGMKPGEAAYGAALEALETAGQRPRAVVFRIVIENRHVSSGRTANAMESRDLNALRDGLDALYQHFVAVKLLKAAARIA